MEQFPHGTKSTAAQKPGQHGTSLVLGLAHCRTEWHVKSVKKVGGSCIFIIFTQNPRKLSL